MGALTRAQLDEVYVSVLTYYTEQVLRHGATPLGVDWSDARTQELRFAQLLTLCDFTAGFELNDVGCGYGALCSYLARCHPSTEIDYLGIDLSPAMIREAGRGAGHLRKTRFAVGNASPRVADYSIASGIFNVKLDASPRRWEQFVAYTLAGLRASSKRGFAVNFKTRNRDNHRAPAGLYVTSPKAWIRFCEQQFGWTAEPLQGYGLDEFTLLVRSPGVS
jgi:SAM-dependent methyltransferase